MNQGYALARAELIRALTAYQGITTTDGAVVGGRGTTLVDTNLIDNAIIAPASIPEKTILIVNGDARGEDKGAASFSNVTGTITLQGTGFNAQIKAGVIYRILNISSIEIDVANIATRIGSQLFSMDFWSDTQEELQVTAGGTTETLPSVTIADLPGTATIVRAIAMFKFRVVENTYAGANAINAAQHIQVQKAAGAWQNAISIADTLFTFTEAAREGGDVLIGDHDIAGEVDANAVYNFQWLDADSLQDFIQYNDIQVGLKILYSV